MLEKASRMGKSYQNGRSGATKASDQPLRLESLSCRARVRMAFSMSIEVWSAACEAPSRRAVR